MAFRVQVAARDSPHIGYSGWTVFPPKSANAKEVYVAAAPTGKATNSGLNPHAPKALLSDGYALLTSGRGDRLNLRAGDTFTGQSFPFWAKSGASANDPMIVRAYGAGARPIISTDDHGWNTAQVCNHVAIRGIEFHPQHAMAGQSWAGIRSTHPCTNLLFEDCIARDYGGNILFQTGAHQTPEYLTNIRLRRCIVLRASDGTGGNDHSEGIYTRGVNTLLIEECAFDHNGWNLALSPPMARNIYSHSIYVSNENTDVTVRGCWLANSSSDGHQLRNGGTSHDNVFLGNALGLSLGMGGDNGYADPLGVLIDVDNCLVLDGQDISGGATRGWGFYCGNIRAGSTVRRLIIAGPITGTFPLPIQLEGNLLTGDFFGQHFPTVGVQSLAFSDITVTGWDGDFFVGSPATVNGCTVTDSAVPPPNAGTVSFINCTDAGTDEVEVAWYTTRLSIAVARPRGAWADVYTTTAAIEHARGELGLS